jgi:DNA invertase Pin-like site-specific DNA recombinase
MIVTAALYARVSTPKQEEEATIDSQIAAIERYMGALGATSSGPTPPSGSR